MGLSRSTRLGALMAACSYVLKARAEHFCYQWGRTLGFHAAPYPFVPAHLKARGFVEEVRQFKGALRRVAVNRDPCFECIVVAAITVYQAPVAIIPRNAVCLAQIASDAVFIGVLDFA